MVILALILLLIGAFVFSRSSFFHVEQFDVEGNAYYTDDEILLMGGCETGKNIFWDIDSKKIRSRLLQDAYMEDVKVRRLLPHTVKITVIVTFLQVFTSSFAAYAFAKLRFIGREVIFLGYIATIALPWQAYMVPQFVLMSKLHLVNTHMSIIMLQAFSAFGVFLMRQFYAGIPDELCEASRIDGLSEYGIWAKVMLPLSKPAISTLIIFTFVGTWNDFLGPYIYLTKTELKTIQIGLRLFISQYTAEYGLIMAGSVITLIPVIIIFLSLQKYFVQGVAASGIKG